LEAAIRDSAELLSPERWQLSQLLFQKHKIDRFGNKLGSAILVGSARRSSSP